MFLEGTVDFIIITLFTLFYFFPFFTCFFLSYYCSFLLYHLFLPFIHLILLLSFFHMFLSLLLCSFLLYHLFLPSIHLILLLSFFHMLLSLLLLLLSLLLLLLSSLSLVSSPYFYFFPPLFRIHSPIHFFSFSSLYALSAVSSVSQLAVKSLILAIRDSSVSLVTTLLVGGSSAAIRDFHLRDFYNGCEGEGPAYPRPLFPRYGLRSRSAVCVAQSGAGLQSVLHSVAQYCACRRSVLLRFAGSSRLRPLHYAN